MAGELRRAAASGERQSGLKDYDAGARRLHAVRNARSFINFTGVTCTNCRWMESNMFT
jgi:hypothetical protein